MGFSQLMSAFNHKGAKLQKKKRFGAPPAPIAHNDIAIASDNAFSPQRGGSRLINKIRRKTDASATTTRRSFFSSSTPINALSYASDSPYSSREALEAERALNDKLEGLKEENTNNVAAIAALQASAQRDVQQLKEQHARHIAAISSVHKVEVETAVNVATRKVKDQHAQEISAVNAELAQTILDNKNALNDAINARTLALESKHEEAMNDFQIQQGEKIRNAVENESRLLQAKNDDRIAALTDAHAVEVAAAIKEKTQQLQQSHASKVDRLVTEFVESSNRHFERGYDAGRKAGRIEANREWDAMVDAEEALQAQLAEEQKQQLEETKESAVNFGLLTAIDRYKPQIDELTSDLEDTEKLLKESEEKVYTLRDRNAHLCDEVMAMKKVHTMHDGISCEAVMNRARITIDELRDAMQQTRTWQQETNARYAQLQQWYDDSVNEHTDGFWKSGYIKAVLKLAVSKAQGQMDRNKEVDWRNRCNEISVEATELRDYAEGLFNHSKVLKTELDRKDEILKAVVEDHPKLAEILADQSFLVKALDEAFEAEEKCIELQREVDSLKIQNRDLDQKVDKLEQEDIDACARINTLETSLKIHQDKCDNFDHLLEQIDDISKRLLDNAAAGTHNTLKQELEQQTQEFETLKDKCLHEIWSRAELDSWMDRKRRENDKLLDFKEMGQEFADMMDICVLEIQRLRLLLPEDQHRNPQWPAEEFLSFEKVMAMRMATSTVVATLARDAQDKWTNGEALVEVFEKGIALANAMREGLDDQGFVMVWSEFNRLIRSGEAYDKYEHVDEDEPKSGEHGGSGVVKTGEDDELNDGDDGQNEMF